MLVLAALGLFFGYVMPTYSGTITESKNQIQSYDSALAAATLFTKKENLLIAQRNAISPQSLDSLNSYMPDGVDNIQLILDLDALAARSGLTLSNFTIQDNSSATASSQNPLSAALDTSAIPLQSTGLTNSLDLSVGATGTYSAFLTFLTSAEQSLRPLDITKIDLKSSKTGVYNYTITFRIYWLK